MPDLGWIIVAAAIVSVLVLYAHLAQAREERDKARQEITTVSGENRRLGAEIERRAMEQLERWRREELGRVRREESEAAKREAKVHLERWKTQMEADIRDDAIRRSQSVTAGKVSEHIAPFMPQFKFNPKDARFIGSPIDLVVFDGLDEGSVREVVLVEVKTGAGSLSARERQVRDAVRAGKVRWDEMRIEAPRRASSVPTRDDPASMTPPGSLYTCRSCGRQNRIPDLRAGVQVRCGSCRQPFYEESEVKVGVILD